MARSLARTLMTALAEAGVDCLFGMPGGGPNLEKIGAGAAAGMRFVLAHGETAACIMASTYGVLTGHPGVCVVTRGPGLASAVNGIAQATLDRYPLLLISDTVPAAQAARIPHQRLAQVALTTPATKWSTTLGFENAAEVARAAVDVALRPPAGAVHLDFDPTSPGDGSRPPLAPVPRRQRKMLDVARDLVSGAHKPIFLVGAEAIPWADSVRAAVQAADAPALTTYQAKGLIPDSWPQAAGLFTNGAMERPVIEAADLIVAVGLDPVEPIPAEWGYPAPVVALHPWELTDPYFEPAVALVGPVDAHLEALAGAWSGDWAPDAGRVVKAAAQESISAEGTGLTPHVVVERLRQAAPPDVVVTVDAGAHFLVVMPLWPVEEPRGLLISNGLATMGFAVPAAIGAALARPDRPVLCIVGDGGLGMTVAELETIARLDVDVTVVVFNDSALSLIEIKQGRDQGGPAAVRYQPIDFAAVARGFGLPAVAADDEVSLAAALGAGWGRGPKLIDVRVDPSVYPHVIKATRG
ncbi:MAG: thiamine pyrophosphate-binding protein [Actinomycetota bacterium]|nr:thiamine pyrophosphate-binding protein [Actinomycetota bacterium]